MSSIARTAQHHAINARPRGSAAPADHQPPLQNDEHEVICRIEGANRHFDNPLPFP